MQTETQKQQYLLDISVAHVVKQGVPAGFIETDGDECSFIYRYRTDDHTKQCAAGPFIKDYEPGMEMLNWRGAIDRFPASAFDPLAVECKGFVENVLQHAHDVAAERTKDYPRQFLSMYASVLQEAVDNYGAPGLVVPQIPGGAS